MQLEHAIREVSERFDYEADGLRIFDSWHVLSQQQERYRGDCEDFALTVFWTLSGQKLSVFLWHLLVTHQYRIYRVRDTNGESHAVACYQDHWFDNWTRNALERHEFFSQTKHQLLHIYPGPLIALYLMIGLVSD